VDILAIIVYWVRTVEYTLETLEIKAVVCTCGVLLPANGQLVEFLSFFVYCYGFVNQTTRVLLIRKEER